MDIKLLAAVLTPVIGGGTWVGGIQSVDWLDSRYARSQLVEDLVWSGMKREIRELRREVEAGEADPEELDDLLDRFCRQYPEDRECD